MDGEEKAFLAERERERDVERRRGPLTRRQGPRQARWQDNLRDDLGESWDYDTNIAGRVADDYIDAAMMHAGKGPADGRESLLGGITRAGRFTTKVVDLDVERAWKTKTGKAAQYMWIMERFVNLTVHVFPFALLLTYVIALLNGWATDPSVNIMALWVYPLIILCLTVPLMAIASIPYTRLTKFVTDPIMAGRIKDGEEKSYLSVFGSILGFWNIVAVVAQFFITVFIVIVIWCWMYNEGWQNDGAWIFWPFKAGRSQALADSLCALTYMMMFWSVVLALHLPSCLAYVFWFVAYIIQILGNKNVSGAIAKVGLGLAMARVARIREHAGLAK